ncbi:MAG: cytochrome P450 [Vicinamibacterales bacterium]
MTRSAAVPSHVPPECVVDVDLYRMPGAEQDLHFPWKQLQDSSPRGLVWTPHNGGHWIVTRGRDIARIYADHENFSSHITIVPRQWGERFPLRPTTLDPPEHRPFRRRLNAALSPAVVRSAQPRIRKLAIEAIERIRMRGRCEFVSEFAEQLPLGVFLHLADLPVDGATGLPGYAEDPIRADGSTTDVPIMDRFAGYLRPHVIERQRHPGDDLISRLVAGAMDDRELTEDEAVEISTAVLTGGLDTIVSSLGLMMAFLARNPAHRRRLIAEPATIRPAVAEMLRRFPIMTKARLVTRDQDIEGVTVKAGEMIVLPPLHGLDDHEFDDPLTVDFDRPPAPNSTFGNGVHRCPGALLSQAELEITLDEWLARIPEFEIDPVRPPTMKGGVLGALLTLELRWEPMAAHSPRSTA